MAQKKFIITQDEKTANQLLAAGFKLVTNVAGSYTFMNIAPANFSFAEVERDKYSYTNILSM
jgi:hypothetical protein